MDDQEIIAERERKQHLTLLKAILPYLPQPVVEEQLTDPDVGRVKGEYWEGSVLFADLSGSLTLIEDLEPEDAGEVIQPVIDAMVQAVHQYGGYLCRVMDRPHHVAPTLDDAFVVQAPLFCRH